MPRLANVLGKPMGIMLYGPFAGEIQSFQPKLWYILKCNGSSYFPNRMTLYLPMDIESEGYIARWVAINPMYLSRLNAGLTAIAKSALNSTVLKRSIHYC